ncbi:MAG: luxR [Novosphingobium sp.]|nr:luxR [Novosphingobium sp.]
MALVALGKTDDVIGQLLGRAPSTVHQHVGEAMRRYSVSTRVQLIVRALFDGQIVFNSLFG